VFLGVLSMFGCDTILLEMVLFSDMPKGQGMA
jgi:hypothetical protein